MSVWEKKANKTMARWRNAEREAGYGEGATEPMPDPVVEGEVLEEETSEKADGADPYDDGSMSATAVEETAPSLMKSSADEDEDATPGESRVVVPLPSQSESESESESHILTVEDEDAVPGEGEAGAEAAYKR